MGEEKIIGRVKKMLALANDSGASEGERDNALRMAYNLIAKYNLSMSSIESHGEESRVDESGSFRGQPWVVSVVNSVAQLFFCKYYFVKKKGMNYDHHFVGKDSNAVTARYMAEFVVTSIIAQGRKESRKVGEASAWRRSFFMGAADRIQSRIREMKDEASASNKADVASGGTSLVLSSVYDSEKEANEAWLESQGVRLRSRKITTKAAAHRDGYASGDSFGKTIQLNRQVGSTKQGALS